MLRFGWQIDRYEAEGKFQFIDAVSPARLGLSENIGGGVLGLDPTGMLIVVSERAETDGFVARLGKIPDCFGLCLKTALILRVQICDRLHLVLELKTGKLPNERNCNSFRGRA